MDNELNVVKNQLEYSEEISLREYLTMMMECENNDDELFSKSDLSKMINERGLKCSKEEVEKMLLFLFNANEGKEKKCDIYMKLQALNQIGNDVNDEGVDSDKGNDEVEVEVKEEVVKDSKEENVIGKEEEQKEDNNEGIADNDNKTNDNVMIESKELAQEEKQQYNPYISYDNQMNNQRYPEYIGEEFNSIIQPRNIFVSSPQQNPRNYQEHIRNNPHPSSSLSPQPHKSLNPVQRHAQNMLQEFSYNSNPFPSYPKLKDITSHQKDKLVYPINQKKHHPQQPHQSSYLAYDSTIKRIRLTQKKAGLENTKDQDYFYQLYQTTTTKSKNIQCLSEVVNKVSRRPYNKFDGNILYQQVQTFSNDYNYKPSFSCNYYMGTTGNSNCFNYSKYQEAYQQPFKQSYYQRENIPPRYQLNPYQQQHLQLQASNYAFKSKNYNLKDPNQKKMYIQTLKDELKHFTLKKNEAKKSYDDGAFKDIDTKLDILMKRKHDDTKTDVNVHINANSNVHKTDEEIIIPKGEGNIQSIEEKIVTRNDNNNNEVVEQSPIESIPKEVNAS